MLKKCVNIVVSVILAVLITVVSGPHELLHSLSHHQDTIDRVDLQHHGLEKRFEKAHIHCDYLGYTLSHYVFPINMHIESFVKICSYKYEQSYYSINSTQCIHYYLRGPPNNLLPMVI